MEGVCNNGIGATITRGIVSTSYSDYLFQTQSIRC